MQYHRAVDGLRALAVLLVVLNHIDAPWASRGFIGVDIFFVISGYLITRRFVVDPHTAQTQTLRDFWAGRARRITPAMILVIVCTFAVAAVVLAPQELNRIGFYGLASSVFGMNFAAIVRGGNYFEGGLRDSPFLHLWSLGVEEQFYVVWPFLMGPSARWWTGGRRQARIFYVVVLAVVGSLSLLMSIVWTQSNPLWAFYGLPTRMYEFVLGAALGLRLIRPTQNQRTSQCAFGGGIAVIVVSLAVTPINRGFPSWWPLLPCLGTAIMIWASSTSAGMFAPRALFESRPAAWLGRYSYGWYLWHWPALILGTAAFRSETAGKVACVGSLAFAVASFHLIENRARYSQRLQRSRSRSLVFGAVLVIVGCVAATATVGWGRLGKRDPRIAAWAQAEESFQAARCTSAMVGGVEVCLGGSTEPGVPTVLLVGDSHAAQWVSAFALAGEAAGFRVALRTYGNCTAVPFLSLPSEPGMEGCWDYQRATLSAASGDAFDAVVFTETGSSRRAHGDVEQWAEAAKRYVDTVNLTGLPTGLLVDHPLYGELLRCMSRGNSESECSAPRSESLGDRNAYLDAESDLDVAGTLDLTDVMCPSDPCPVEVEGVIVPAGRNHLNRDFAESQSERVATFVLELIHAGT